MVSQDLYKKTYHMFHDRMCLLFMFSSMKDGFIHW